MGFWCRSSDRHRFPQRRSTIWPDIPTYDPIRTSVVFVSAPSFVSSVSEEKSAQWEKTLWETQTPPINRLSWVRVNRTGPEHTWRSCTEQQQLLHFHPFYTKDWFRASSWSGTSSALKDWRLKLKAVTCRYESSEMIFSCFLVLLHLKSNLSPASPPLVFSCCPHITLPSSVNEFHHAVCLCVCVCACVCVCVCVCGGG